MDSYPLVIRSELALVVTTACYCMFCVMVELRSKWHRRSRHSPVTALPCCRTSWCFSHLRLSEGSALSLLPYHPPFCDLQNTRYTFLTWLGFPIFQWRQYLDTIWFLSFSTKVLWHESVYPVPPCQGDSVQGEMPGFQMIDWAAVCSLLEENLIFML